MKAPLAALAFLLACSGVGAAFGAAATHTVAQKRRTFAPKELTIAEGDTVIFVNDDGELVHHAYAKSPTFSFDIGEQKPGTQVPVRFSKQGTFQVRCDIHPRMLLDVTVR